MQKKSILIFIIVFMLIFTACGAKKGITLDKGALVYQVLTGDEKITALKDEYPACLYIGYEIEKAYYSAPVEDLSEIAAICDALTELKVGDKVNNKDVASYPLRYMNFDFGDGLDHELYFTDDCCYTYDSETDVLNYYRLDNSEEFIDLFDKKVNEYNEFINDLSSSEEPYVVENLKDLLAVSDYLVFDDDNCSALITDYNYESNTGILTISLALNNQSEENKHFHFKNLTVNGEAVETDSWFIIDAGANVNYNAPLDISAADAENLSEVDFTFNVTNAEENPTYNFTTDEISLVMDF